MSYLPATPRLPVQFNWLPVAPVLELVGVTLTVKPVGAGKLPDATKALKLKSPRASAPNAAVPASDVPRSDVPPPSDRPSWEVPPPSDLPSWEVPPPSDLPRSEDV